MVSKDQTCEEWLKEIKTRPRPKLLLEYFAANITKHQTPSPTNSTTTATTATNTTTTTTTNTNTTNTTNTTANDTTASLLMYCRHCTKKGVEGSARAFIAAPPPQLVFCTNRLKSKKALEEVFVHEMIHAVDYCTRAMDLTECEALACSEIRAAREAECLTAMELEWNGKTLDTPWPVSAFTKKGCTKRLATAATQNMFPGHVGETCVEKMFEQCYKDRVPFDERPPMDRDAHK
jgi:hypothetical protein